MFTASAFSLMRQNCPAELNELLRLLKINYKPDWEHGDEFKIAEKLDDEINKKICALLKSDSDLAGYAKLLDMGGIGFSVSETRKERLGKILANRNKILQGAAAQTSDKNSSADSDLSLWARIVRFFKGLFGSDEPAPPQPSDKLS